MLVADENRELSSPDDSTWQFQAPVGRGWWAIVDSNHGPQSYQDCALTV